VSRECASNNSRSGQVVMKSRHWIGYAIFDGQIRCGQPSSTPTGCEVAMGSEPHDVMKRNDVRISRTKQRVLFARSADTSTLESSAIPHEGRRL